MPSGKIISLWPCGAFSNLEMDGGKVIAETNEDRHARARCFIESEITLLYTLVVCISAFPVGSYAQGLSSTKSDRAPCAIIAFSGTDDSGGELLRSSNICDGHIICSYDEGRF